MSRMVPKRIYLEKKDEFMSLNIELLRESFEVAKPLGIKITDKFYEFLFADYPQVKPMFENIDQEKQKAALLNSLVYIVDHLDQPEKLQSYLENMGGRHVGYGTEEAHYPAVGGTLLQTFEFFFQDKWTEELKSEWTKAYEAVAGMMIEGARKYQSVA